MSKLLLSHPGVIFRDRFLIPLNLTVSGAARAMDVPRETLRDFVAGDSPLTPALALKVGAITGTGASAWMLAQSRYDLDRAWEDPALQGRVGTIRAEWAPKNSKVRTSVLDFLFPSGLPRAFSYFLKPKQ